MALTGASGTPLFIARTANEFHPKTRSFEVNPTSPQFGSMTSSPPISLGSCASAARISEVRLEGRHSAILICPRASVRLASAWTKIVAGSANKPPQLPEWCARLRKDTSRSKLTAPRDPMNMVGISGINRGPSDAISTSAARASRCAAQNSARPGDPISSAISIRTLTLNPSDPRRSIRVLSAKKLIRCWIK